MQLLKLRLGRFRLNGYCTSYSYTLRKRAQLKKIVAGNVSYGFYAIIHLFGKKFQLDFFKLT